MRGWEPQKEGEKKMDNLSQHTWLQFPLPTVQRPKHSNSQIWSSLEQWGNVLDLHPLCILYAPTCFWLSEKISYCFVKTSKKYHIKSVWWLVIPRTECVKNNHFSNNFTVCNGMWMSKTDVSSSSWPKHLNGDLCILQSLVWEAWKKKSESTISIFGLANLC